MSSKPLELYPGDRVNWRSRKLPIKIQAQPQIVLYLLPEFVQIIF
ncbi:hypothetical protein [Scytonema millei]|nr:hypothetical protein [Scytonema millei]